MNPILVHATVQTVCVFVDAIAFAATSFARVLTFPLALLGLMFFQLICILCSVLTFVRYLLYCKVLKASQSSFQPQLF